MAAMIEICGGSGKGEHGPRTKTAPFFFEGGRNFLVYGRHIGPMSDPSRVFAVRWPKEIFSTW